MPPSLTMNEDSRYTKQTRISAQPSLLRSPSISQESPSAISNTVASKMGPLPPPLSEAYDDLKTQIRVLRFLRPHPGIWLESADAQGDQSSLALLQKRGSYDSGGLDIALELLRHLKTFGYEEDNQNKPTPEWRIFFEAASLDIGWKRSEDWVCKRALLEILKHSVHSEPLSFHELYLRKELRCMFTDHMQFQILSEQFVYAEDGGKRFARDLDENQWKSLQLKHKVGALPAETFRKFFLVKKSQHRARYHRLGLCPKFLQITHHVKTDGPSFKKLQYFGIDVPSLLDGSICVEKTIYQLCAVVKLKVTENVTEDIRTYGSDGAEVVTPTVGEVSMLIKEPLSAQEQRWSVQEAGSYRLFYYRVFVPDGELYTPPQHHQEYEVRPWAVEEDSSPPQSSPARRHS